MKKQKEQKENTEAQLFWFQGCGWEKDGLVSNWKEEDFTLFQEMDKDLKEQFEKDYFKFVNLLRRNTEAKSTQVGVKGFETVFY